MEYQLSVGYNGKIEDLKRIVAASEKVKDVYTGGLSQKVAGGRYQYAESLDKLAESVEYVHSKGLSLSVTMNAPAGVNGKSDTIWWNDIKNYLKDLESIGVNKVIIAHPYVLSLAKETTNMTVIASTVCEIVNARQAVYYENMGADIIVPSTAANMYIDDLRTMKQALKQAKLKILVNEPCLGNCPYRRFHQVSLAFANKKTCDLDYVESCYNIYKKNPHFILSNNVIRPEDLIAYEGICNNFKLIGRTTEIHSLEKMVKGYGDGFYDGNFLDLIDEEYSKMIYIENKRLDGLIKAKFRCNKDCFNCNHCKIVYENNMIA